MTISPLLSFAADKWVSPIDTKYRSKNSELYQQFDQARNILDAWRGEGEKLSQAQKILQSILKKDATYAPAFLELGRAYIMAGYINRNNYDATALSPAEASIKKALEIEPNYADAYVLLGHLYTNIKQYNEARIALQKADSIGTQNPWLQINWATLLEKMGDWDGAAKRYQIVFDSKTQNRKAYEGALEGLITCSIHKGDMDAADRWHKEQVAYSPSSAWAWGNYASFQLFEHNDVSGAIKNGEKALSIMDYGMGRFILACALYTKWALMAEHNPTNPEIQPTFNRAYSLYPDIDSVISETMKYKSTGVTASQLTMYQNSHRSN